MKKLRLLSFTLTLCFIALFANAQNRQIQGTVRDLQGVIPGATVIEKGAVPVNGVATTVDGKFTITLKGKSQILIIRSQSYVTKEVEVTGSTINVTLESKTQDLNEVVVVGYGAVQKKTLTGAQSAVSGADIRQNPSASLQNTLAGRLTGFISQQTTGQPGSDGANFLVRGVSSLNGNNNPLIIVDDIEFNYDQFRNIDPNEVESVTVLKDASQTAVYGIKGANGVVVVTTRRGKSGKPRMSFRNDFGVSQPTKLPTYLDAYNTALLVNQANTNDGVTPRWTAADLALFQNGQDPYGHPNINWRDELFKKFAKQYKSTFDLQGGTENVKYFVSLSYINQGGLTKDFSEDQGYNGNYFNHRYNYRSNLDIKANKNLDIQINAYGNIGQVNVPSVYYPSTNGNKNDVFGEYGSFLALSPYAYPIKNPDGSWGYSNYQSNVTNYITPNIIQRLTLDGYNRTNLNNMVLSGQANEKLDFITKGLSARGLLAYTSNYSNTIGLTRVNLPSYIYNPTNSTYTPAFANIYRLERLGTAYNGGSTQRRVTAQASLNYDRSFGSHHINSLLLYNLSSYNASLPVTNINYDNYNFVPSVTLGTTARVTYDFKQKYIVTLSGAYNGTDRFQKHYGFFPAVSAAYNIAEESFMKNNVKFIDVLKFRASYGLIGSDLLGSGQTYVYLQSYLPSGGNQAISFGETNGATLPANNGLQEGTLPNPAVTWEKSKQLNIGADFALFNKINGAVDVFNNDRYDQLIQRGTVSAIFGQSLPPVNLGKTNTRGFEVELNYHDKIGKDFTFNARGTFSKVKSKIIFQDEPSTLYPWQYYTGHPLGAQARYHFLGFYNAADIANPAVAKASAGVTKAGDLKYEDLNKDGFIDGKDQAVSDLTNTPINNFGAQLGFAYKGFSMSALFQGATGFVISGSEEAIRAFSANLQPIHQQAWTPELGDNAKYPYLTTTRTISDPSSASDFWTISGNYLRLRTAEFAYSFPAKFVSKIGLQSLRIYLSGNNLYTWSDAYKKYALDPEATYGTTQQNYPPQRIYNIGLNITL
ncbi:SusC/RagA family TonB-linked outer membrane protein [Pedobacter mendelii]|nr:TonB-dependent receptor [Pedobacter mendelii]